MAAVTITPNYRLLYERHDHFIHMIKYLTILLRKLQTKDMRTYIGTYMVVDDYNKL